MKQLFLALTVALVVFYVFTFGAVLLDLSLPLPARSTGIWLGRLSLITYFLTLVPGMARRTRIGIRQVVPLMTNRRQLGVLMFWLALGHWLYLTLLPTLMFNLPILLDSARLAGMISLAILTPLWLTSNDFAQRKLGKKWRYLHNLTHLVVGLLFLHVAFFSAPIAILAALVLLINSISWAMEWRRRLAAEAAAGTASTNPSPKSPTQTPPQSAS